jgi:hypothetical protein
MAVNNLINTKNPKRVNDALTKRVHADYECFMVLMNHENTLLSALDLALMNGGIDEESHQFITRNIRKVVLDRIEANDEFVNALIG